MSIRSFSTSDEGAGAEDLRRLYKAGYQAGVAISPELQLELRQVVGVLGGIVPISSCGNYWYDAPAAERSIDFFRTYLVHIKGELGRKPIEPMEWEADRILRPLFGWRRWDGTRRYRRAWIEVPRKNDKTTLAAGISLYLTFADGEPGAEIYAAAADKAQAAICFDIASAMVQSSAPLFERCEVFRRSIAIPATFTKYEVLSADAFTKHGLNAHGVVVDEVHAQPNRDLIDVLDTSTSSRRQPLQVYITTAGFDKHSICYEMHEHALRVRDWNDSGGALAGSLQDDALLVVIYAADPTDDWRLEATWEKANPGLGRSKKWDYMREKCQRAIQVPGYENVFKRLDLNIWTEQASRWLPMDKWDLCVGELELKRLGVTVAELRDTTHKDYPSRVERVRRGVRLGSAAAADPTQTALELRQAMLRQKCFGGLDLANTIDINAFSLVFMPGKMRLVVVPFFWIPEERLRDREKIDKVPWALWVKAGLVKVMPGAAADYDMIEQDIELLAKQYQIEEIGIDRWNALAIATHLENGPAGRAAKARDLKRENFIYGVGQGFASMTTPCKALETSVVAVRLEHGNNPVLRWMAANVAAQRDAADNIKPDKQASAEKIDGISSTLDGMARALVYQPAGSIDDWLRAQVTSG